MNKLMQVILLTMFLAQFMAAQAPVSIDRPAEPNMLFDDDGGKVQIVPADLAPAQKTFHGGAVMTSVQQVSIFLGSGWSDAQVRSRQRGLSDVTASGSADLTEIRSRKISTMPAAPQVDDFSNLSNTPLNDLDIQRRLDQMLKSKAIPAPNASTVYVVFLAPGTMLTLGGTKAGVDFAAYHNVVHLDAGEVRYAVVPFHADAQKHAAAAARAFAETALNPTGQGWY
ncbi:MAG TPA: hypothetical protein VE783_05575 [Candidatus Limnocylindrales bacterium]|nr:hypothetical protein [Candidatus Limnocylindrales bacterium]